MYEEDNFEEELDKQPHLWRKVLFVIITLVLVFAILATTILPGLLAAQRNDYLRTRPTPTILPRT
jgi:hypothetical protein